jgi:hypothetical protein
LLNIKGTSWVLRISKTGMTKNGVIIDRARVISVGDVTIVPLFFAVFPEGSFSFKREACTALGAVLRTDASTFSNELVVVELDYVHASTTVITSMPSQKQHFCAKAKDYICQLMAKAESTPTHLVMDGEWLSKAISKAMEVEGMDGSMLAAWQEAAVEVAEAAVRAGLE